MWFVTGDLGMKAISPEIAKRKKGNMKYVSYHSGRLEVHQNYKHRLHLAGTW